MADEYRQRRTRRRKAEESSDSPRTFAEQPGEQEAETVSDLLVQNAGPDVARQAAVVNRSDSGTRQGVALRLQGTLGNQHMQRVVARYRNKGQERLFEYTWDDIYGAYLSEFADLTDADKLEMAELILARYTRLGKAPSVLRNLWGSFGAKLPKVAASNIALWKKSADFVTLNTMEDLPLIEELQKTFSSDVEKVAESFLEINSTKVQEQYDAVVGERGEEASPEKAKSQEQALKELQGAASVVLRAQDRRAALRDEQVGYQWVTMEDPDENPQQSVYYDPEAEPEEGPEGTEQPPLRHWEQVKAEDEQLKEVISVTLAQYPAIFALLREGKLKSFLQSADAGSPDAKKAVQQSLSKLRDDIHDASIMLSLGEINPLDLLPIHAQLFGGRAAKSGTPWSNPFYKWVGESAVSGHQRTEFWKTLGVGTLGAAAFIFAEIATGGFATFAFAALGTGVTAFQIGNAWEELDKFTGLEKARTGEHDRLVYREQVEAKQVDFGLEVAFGMFDVYGLAKMGGKLMEGAAAAHRISTIGQSVGEEAAAGLNLSLSGLKAGDANASAVVERSIDNLGVQETLRRSGHTPDELIEIVGAESAAGVRLRNAQNPLFQRPAEAEDVLPTLSKFEPPADARMYDQSFMDVVARETYRLDILHAIELRGPLRVLQQAGGWQKLIASLGDEAEASKRLMAWRDDVLGTEIIEFAQKNLPHNPGQPTNIVRTGTTGKPTNDFDWDLLGPHSSANRQQVRAFLAGRLGVGEGELKKLLHADFFTDPRRLHLYDQMPNQGLREVMAKEEARFSEELIYNRRLYEAEEKGNSTLAEALREEMERRGIDEGYIPLSEADISSLYRDMDDWHQQLEEAIQNADVATQETLIRRIGQTQGQINVVEKGGYASGGGGRMFVTEPEGIPGKLGDDEFATRAPMLPAQEYGAALDQLLKLDDVMDEITKAVTDGDLFSAIKSVSKYASRFGDSAESSKVITGKLIDALGTSEEAFNQMWSKYGKFVESSNDFKMLTEQARGKAGASLSERIAKDKDTVLSQARSALDKFSETHGSVLDALRARADIESVLGDVKPLLEIQKLTLQHVKLSRAIETLTERLARLNNLPSARLADVIEAMANLRLLDSDRGKPNDEEQ